MNERRRILLVTTDFPPAIGGIQEWTSQVAQGLALRHDVTVITPGHRDSACYDATAPFRVVRYPATRHRMTSLGALTLTMAGEIVRARSDIVLFGHIFAAVAARPLCRRFAIPYVVATYGMEVQAHRVQRFLRAAVVGGKRCIAISRHTARLLGDKGVPPAMVDLVGVGVPSHVLAAPVQTAAAARLLPGRDGPVILTLARLDERYKGHDMMLRALPLILAQVPDTTYVIAGDGRYRRYYEQLAASLGVRDHVIFTGRVSDEERLALYDRCDLFALISREEVDGGAEGFGIVFLEAAARGKPAIGGRSGGIPDAIVDGTTGLLVDPTDIHAIADACVTLLTDRALARRLGEAGRRRVQESYTWDHIARQVEAVLQGALTDTATGTRMAA